MRRFLTNFFTFLIVPCGLLALTYLTGDSSAHAEAAPIQVVDDLGRTVSLKEPAKHIISLYGAFTEMLFAIGAGPDVVARTQADQFPPEITKLPSVGTHMRPNVEMILGLKPDLVVYSASRRDTAPELDRLRETGLSVAVFEPRTFNEIFSVVKRLGVLTGRENEAQNAVAGLQKRLDAVKGRLAGITKPQRVFFEVRAEPLTAAGRSSIVQEIFTAAGAENALKNDKAIVQYSFEALLLDNPDVYIVQQGPMNRNPADPRRRSHFEQLRSIREGKVIFVDEFLYSRPGPRCVDAVEQLAAALYPDRLPKDAMEQSGAPAKDH